MGQKTSSLNKFETSSLIGYIILCLVGLFLISCSSGLSPVETSASRIDTIYSIQIDTVFTMGDSNLTFNRWQSALVYVIAPNTVSNSLSITCAGYVISVLGAGMRDTLHVESGTRLKAVYKSTKGNIYIRDTIAIDSMTWRVR